MKEFDSRKQVTDWILSQKVRRGISWNDVSQQLSCSRVWCTAACLGQMKLDRADAEKVDDIFGMKTAGISWLQRVPYRTGPTIPTDPLLYRLCEALGVYESAIKELIHEDLGDGIMSAIDFDLDLDTKSVKDRVVMTWSGKFLPYKKF